MPLTVSYQWYNAAAPAPIEGWNFTYIFTTVELTSDGVILDSYRSPPTPRPGCAHITQAKLRTLADLVNGASFLTAFDAVAQPLAETVPARQEDTVTIVIGQRRATFPRVAVPAPIRRLLDVVDSAYAAACHSALPSFGSQPLH